MKLTLEVQKDPKTGELYLQFPDELVDQLGWAVGDELSWTNNKDGTWTLTKNQ
jgi:hypothetical protein